MSGFVLCEVSCVRVDETLSRYNILDCPFPSIHHSTNADVQEAKPRRSKVSKPRAHSVNVSKVAKKFSARLTPNKLGMAPRNSPRISPRRLRRYGSARLTKRLQRTTLTRSIGASGDRANENMRNWSPSTPSSSSPMQPTPKADDSP